MEEEIQVFVNVKGYGSLLSDLCIGFNSVRNKFYKMALFEGKFRVIEAPTIEGPWRLKNDGSKRLNPTRIVNYTSE